MADDEPDAGEKEEGWILTGKLAELLAGLHQQGLGPAGVKVILGIRIEAFGLIPGRLVMIRQERPQRGGTLAGTGSCLTQRASAEREQTRE